MHNLDLDIQEYFEFQIKGHCYRFRQPTTEEMQMFAKLDTKDETGVNEFIYQFITPIDNAPKFEDVAKQMLLPHWKKFREMIETELSVK